MAATPPPRGPSGRPGHTGRRDGPDRSGGSLPAEDSAAAARGPCGAPVAGGWSALVLAGRRAEGDPLAERAGVSHKALIPVAGVPMLTRVLGALAAVEGLERIAVSIDRADILAGLGDLRTGPSSPPIAVHASRESPAASVLDFLTGRPADETVLVTTADHPLLTVAALEYFRNAVAGSAADAVVGVVTEETLHAAGGRGPHSPLSAASARTTARGEGVGGDARGHRAPPREPGLATSRRTLFPLRGERIAGANLFALRGEGGRRAAAFWRRTEQLRKRPWRLVALLGLGPLALLALRRLALEDALARASARMGARIEAVRLPFAECAVDVDRPEDLELVGRLLRSRETADPKPATAGDTGRASR